MKKAIFILLGMIFIFPGNFSYSQNTSVIDMEGLENPTYVVADNNIMLILDNSKVKMFSMKDFKLMKTIGRKGEGPAEFKIDAFPQILPNCIMISSHQKVSFFNFSGEFIKEQKIQSRRAMIKKAKDKYVSFSFSREKDEIYIIYNLYAPDFTKEKVLHKGKSMFHKDGKLDIFEIFYFDVYDEKIIFAHREGFEIEILDENGNKLHTIKEDPPKIPFTDKDLNQVFKEMETNSKEKELIKLWKEKYFKPDYYPPIRTCRAADGKIYVVTYLKENEGSECLIYNLEGKQLKKVFIPLKGTSHWTTPPFTINNGYLYQVIDNLEKEQWQLIIDKIE